MKLFPSLFSCVCSRVISFVFAFLCVLYLQIQRKRPQNQKLSLPFVVRPLTSFLLVRDRYKCVTWVNIPQLKLGLFRGYSLIFKTECVVRNIHWRMINAIASTCSDMCPRIAQSVCSSKQSCPRATLSENCLPLGTDTVRRQICLFLLYGQLRERARWIKSCAVIGYPNGKDRATLPARD